MLKKRLIFTLLYDNGHFMLSRNFRLQKVGNLEWLEKNYNFSKISAAIDELVVLDVTRSERNIEKFSEALKSLTRGCFMPIAAGGGIETMDQARLLLRSGADKIVVNTALFSMPQLIHDLSKEFGQQCIVGSLDLKKNKDSRYCIYSQNGEKKVDGDAEKLILDVGVLPIGELYLNSIERDGTGNGLDIDMLNILPGDISIPVILAGGVGNVSHISEGLANHKVDAVATANLLNFIGDGLSSARQSLQKMHSLANFLT